MKAFLPGDTGFAHTSVIPFVIEMVLKIDSQQWKFVAAVIGQLLYFLGELAIKSLDSSITSAKLIKKLLGSITGNIIL